MAVPRPVLLALLGLALCAAAFMATRGAREPGGSVAATPAAPAPAKAAKHAAGVKPHAAKAAHKAPAHTATKPQTHAAKPQAKPQPKAAAPARHLSATQKLALRVTKALGRGDAVVFLFSRPGAADDTSTRQAVKAAQREPHVTVVRAGLNDLSTFRSVVSGAGVSQVPAVVVAHAGKPARLLQGFVDSGTLRQTVADALR